MGLVEAIFLAAAIVAGVDAVIHRSLASAALALVAVGLWLS